MNGEEQWPSLNKEPPPLNLFKNSKPYISGTYEAINSLSNSSTISKILAALFSDEFFMSLPIVSIKSNPGTLFTFQTILLSPNLLKLKQEACPAKPILANNVAYVVF